MFLFIIEGERQEHRILKTLQHLFLKEPRDDEILFHFCNNIFSLHSLMKRYDLLDGSADLVNILKEELSKHPNNQSDLDKISHSDQVAEIYLFFDCDLKKIDDKNKITIEEQCNAIKELLEYFSDESNGKLYINYPMIESFRYFKSVLPDLDYKDYTVDALIDGDFKNIAGQHSIFKNYKNLCFNKSKSGFIQIPQNQNHIDVIKNNWKIINNLNIMKANYISNDSFSIPSVKDSISQKAIFYNQVEKYIKPNGVISILNSFSLFLFDYIDLSKDTSFFE